MLGGGIADVSAFGDGSQFLAARNLVHEVVGRALAECRAVGVDVCADDVDTVVSGVPFFGRFIVAFCHVNGPAPYQVVQTMVVYKAVVEEAVELPAGFGTIASPPEPCSALGKVTGVAACGFVEGPEDDGDIRLLEVEQVACHLVDVAEDALVLPCPLLQGFADVELRFALSTVAAGGIESHVVC